MKQVAALLASPRHLPHPTHLKAGIFEQVLAAPPTSPATHLNAYFVIIERARARPRDRIGRRGPPQHDLTAIAARHQHVPWNMVWNACGVHVVERVLGCMLWNRCVSICCVKLEWRCRRRLWHVGLRQRLIVGDRSIHTQL